MAARKSPSQVFDHKLGGQYHQGRHYHIPDGGLTQRQRRELMNVAEVISVCGSFQRCKCTQACQTFIVPKTAQLSFELRQERGGSLRFNPA